MKREFILIVLVVHLFSCKKTYEVIMPDTNNWESFNSPAATTLPGTARSSMEGVYNIIDAADIFGNYAALKWSYVINNTDTTWHLSGFLEKDIAYFICEGKQLNGSILLNGYWRKMVNTETGIVRLTILPGAGATNLLSSAPVVAEDSIIIAGIFGDGQKLPEIPVSFTYKRKLNKNPAGFQIIAHRSGGRTSDLLPVSENSVEMILKTAEFGSTGIEVDVRFTRDGMPILYHDKTLNLREVQKCGLVGPIENYTYDQLTTFVRLIHGEKIPTLREALTAVVDRTDLSFVWLDTKFIGSLAPVHALQQEFIQKARVQGRNLRIVIGLPGQDQVNEFLRLPDYANTPSLCELGLDQVARTNAKIWAPRFTEGLQNDLVDAVHAQGKQAFVWTVDVPEFISNFINLGKFDGILTNFPSCVAYNYYVRP